MAQVLDKNKREKIRGIAAALFAARPFHQVRLDEIAARAKVGKGTLYTYFKSKEDLYFDVLYEGFAKLVDQLKSCLSDGEKSPQEALRVVVRQFAAYALDHPHLFELIRKVGTPSNGNPNWARKRRELIELIEQIIRRGVYDGVFEDPHPSWTAQLIPGMVRSIFLSTQKPRNSDILAEHVLRFLEAGLAGSYAPS